MTFPFAPKWEVYNLQSYKNYVAKSGSQAWWIHAGLPFNIPSTEMSMSVWDLSYVMLVAVYDFW